MGICLNRISSVFVGGITEKEAMAWRRLIALDREQKSDSASAASATARCGCSPDS